MAARKKTAKKAPARKKPAARNAAKKKAPAKKKAAAPKTPKARAAAPAKPAAAKPAPATRPAPAPAAPAAEPVSGGPIRAEEVTLGHVMALRPRIHVGFKPSAFGEAKRALADAGFDSIEAAARAVAEKAIEISNDAKSPFGRG